METAVKERGIAKLAGTQVLAAVRFAGNQRKKNTPYEFGIRVK